MLKIISTLLVLWIYSTSITFSQTINGFDLSNSSIPPEKILSGGPPKDGIPSIDNPKYISARKVSYLKDDDMVIGFVQAGRARAYPLRILAWHEIVNDIIEGVPVAVTYCPLCGTGMVFDRTIGGKVRTFGVSGLLYQSDVLMYDRESESLWSQLGMEAVSGSQVGNKLKWLQSEYSTWSAWLKRHPDGEVLSMETGFNRNYGRNAYTSYFASEKPMFPVTQTRGELPYKEWIIGVMIDGQAKAYPASSLPANDVIEDTVGGKNILVSYDATNRYPLVKGSEGHTIPSVMAFWFAWQAFYPETELWKPSITTH